MRSSGWSADPAGTRHPLALPVVAALLGLLLIGSMAVGAQLLKDRDERLTLVPPSPAASATAVDPVLTPAPGVATSPDPGLMPPAIPAIDAGFQPAGDGTRGAFAMRLDGPLRGARDQRQRLVQLELGQRDG